MSSLDGLPPPRKYWALAATLLAMAMTVLETTITNVALPSIARDLGVSPAQAVWIVNTYQLAIVVALLPFSSLGEILGYRRVFGVGLTAFTIASAGCAMSTSFTMLISFRVFQGLGAAAVMSVTPALLRFIYSQKQFGRAIGFNALVVATSSAAGPMLGSLILSVSSWPWLFAVNIPIGLFILSIGSRMLPETELAKRRFDALSAILSGLTFGLLVVGVDRLIPDFKTAAILLGGAALAGLALVRRELAQPTPLLPLDLLRIRQFAFSVGASVCAFSGQTMSYVSLPFYFQQVLGRSQLEIGMLMVPWPLAVAIAAPVAGRLSETIAPAILCSVGAGLVTLGLLLIALLPAETPNGWIMACMVISGTGFGMFQTPNNRVMLTAPPRHRSGGAGGLQATARQFGMALGAALVALTFTAVPSHGPTTGLVVAAVFLAAASAISAARPGTRPSG
ncbi:MAG: MFS transporter [Pigmentiphaga sp.]|uniref:MFS transporter n=1 Tax=Pigmentiphaga sp. TaxID=1977564 RepID=UPI0029A15534|nr:MFS transporter [Pigmentiphaga sp.]MDX3907840.1 MFS transporter [Pigmentiphaga sp.]